MFGVPITNVDFIYLKIPEDYDVEMIFAVGLPGKEEELSKELQEKEYPSNRKPLKEIIFEGRFKE